MATAASDVLKPDHASARKHLIFTDEHEDLRESMKSWVLKELAPHAEEWEENLWPDSVLRRMEHQCSGIPTAGDADLLRRRHGRRQHGRESQRAWQ